MADPKPAWRAGIRLRPAQEEILRYQGGRMAILAVPGSGKTFTLSLLAADLLQRDLLRPHQEILIVTFARSAVDNFNVRIAGFLKNAGRIAGMGYRVRTLHSLANDIIRVRPEAVGLPEDFAIIDEYESDQLKGEVADAWLRAHPDFFDQWLKEDASEKETADWKTKGARRVVNEAVVAAVGWAKDHELNPDQLEERMRPSGYLLTEMAADLYRDYQRALEYRGAVDFSDLIRLALRALRNDPTLVERYQDLFPYILEDEAQDSTNLQEQILSLIAGKDGNWVRVGDPNQAIYASFTMSSPEYLRRFSSAAGVTVRTLPESGRSQQAVIDLANHLITFSLSRDDHLNGTLSLPLILPTAAGDPQPNPPADPTHIRMALTGRDPDSELNVLVNSIESALKHAKGAKITYAVLVSSNLKAENVRAELEKRNIPVVDALLDTSTASRSMVKAVSTFLNWLALPLATGHVTQLFNEWSTRQPDLHARAEAVTGAKNLLGRLTQVEDFLAPLPGHEWPAQVEPDCGEVLERFRTLLSSWQELALLPASQAVLTFVQDVFSSDPAQLALGYKVSKFLRRLETEHPEYSLRDLSEEVKANKRQKGSLSAISLSDTGFDPSLYPGKVVICTQHKAKGLEWDRVYIPAANNYDFPSAAPYDTFFAEGYQVRGRLNIVAEMLAQLDLLLSRDPYAGYVEGEATQEARQKVSQDRLRLFYVSITRAKRDLVISWNTGKNRNLVKSVYFQHLLELEDSFHAV